MIIKCGFCLKTKYFAKIKSEGFRSPYKKGLSNIALYYRPVSLASIVSKMLEYIIFSFSMKHLNSYKIVTPSQHGFRSKRSRNTQLFSTVQGI